MENIPKADFLQVENNILKYLSREVKWKMKAEHWVSYGPLANSCMYPLNLWKYFSRYKYVSKCDLYIRNC